MEMMRVGFNLGQRMDEGLELCSSLLGQAQVEIYECAHNAYYVKYDIQVSAQMLPSAPIRSVAPTYKRCEAFVADSEFRRKLKDTVAATKGGSAFIGTLPDGRKREVDRGEYTVVYGIMRHRYVDGSIGIPFFSKVSFMAACDRLRRTGMNIRKEIIEKLPPAPGSAATRKKSKGTISSKAKSSLAQPSRSP